jgi:hypothetical protein
MRKSNMTRTIVAMLALAAITISGCAPSNVKMRRETVDWQQEKAMVQRSLERFDAAFFYAYEWRPGITAAVVADLKEDDKTIRPGQGWRKIGTPEDLERVYKGGTAVKAKSAMRLYRIEGNDGEIWGYFFAPQNILPYSTIDDKTIELGQIPEPPAPP